MEQADFRSGHWITETELEHIEHIILAALHMRKAPVGQAVDMAQLHEDCLSIGYSVREISHGLVRLLFRKYLQPCGDMSFALTPEGCLAGKAALLSDRWGGSTETMKRERKQ